jgi:hypothetical protein
MFNEMALKNHAPPNTFQDQRGQESHLWSADSHQKPGRTIFKLKI